MPRRAEERSRRSAAEAMLVVDLGGSNLRIALVDKDLTLIRRVKEPKDHDAHPKVILQRLRDARRSLEALATVKVIGVGFALAGILNAESGIVHQCPHLPNSWRGFQLRTALEQSLGLPVAIGNDANLAALAEVHAQAPDARCLLYITFSTGIGGGVVCQGKPFLGGNGLGPEVGHIVVVADGPACDCGGRGCLEALASGTAIAREAKEAASRDPSGVMASLVQKGRTLDAKMVHEAAVKGDDAARTILENAGYYLGLGLASLAHIFCPDIIVVGGSIRGAGEMVMGPARQAFATQTMRAYQDGVRIVSPALGDDSALVGAALAIWSQAQRCT